MPTFHTGDMWSVFDEVDYFCFTANNVVTSSGRLVMGAGIAKQVRDRFPGIDKKFGTYLNVLNRDVYGLMLVNSIIAFQTKRQFMNLSCIEVIKQSTNELSSKAAIIPSKKYCLNYPGIGHGGLPKSIVEPIIQTLPDNVQIWSY